MADAEKRDTPELLIWVVPQTLSDKSIVYNVEFGGLKFSAVDEDAAEALAEGFAELINEHTCETADVMWA